MRLFVCYLALDKHCVRGRGRCHTSAASPPSMSTLTAFRGGVIIAHLTGRTLCSHLSERDQRLYAVWGPFKEMFGCFCLHLGWTALSAIMHNNMHVWGDTIMEGGHSCRDGEKVTNLGQRRAMIPCRFSEQNESWYVHVRNVRQISFSLHESRMSPLSQVNTGAQRECLVFLRYLQTQTRWCLSMGLLTLQRGCSTFSGKKKWYFIVFVIFPSSCCPLKITPAFKRQTGKKKSRFQYDRTRFCRRSEMENVSCVFFPCDCGRKTVIG